MTRQTARADISFREQLAELHQPPASFLDFLSTITLVRLVELEEAEYWADVDAGLFYNEDEDTYLCECGQRHVFDLEYNTVHANNAHECWHQAFVMLDVHEQQRHADDLLFYDPGFWTYGGRHYEGDRPSDLPESCSRQGRAGHEGLASVEAPLD